MNNDENGIIIYELLTVIGIFDAGGQYYNDEIGSYATRYGSYDVANDNIIYYDSLDEIFDWFKKNAGKIVPEIRTIEYVSNYKGLTDVIKITSLSKGYILYVTAVNEEDFLIWSDLTKYWDINIYNNTDYSINIFNICNIYNLFEEKGLILKNNVFKTGTERIEYNEKVKEKILERRKMRWY